MAEDEARAAEADSEVTERTAATTDGEVTAIERVREFAGTGVFWAILTIILVSAAIVAVVVQNTHDVEFEFLWFDIETALLTIILVTALIAALATETVAAFWRSRRRKVLTEREELKRLRGGRSAEPEPARRRRRGRR